MNLNRLFRYMHDPKHYQICIDREDPSVVYIALKNRLMTSHSKDWALDDANRLLLRLVEALDEDLSCVKDYIEKVRRRLEAKKDDTDFTRMHAFFMLSMCLSKPHQVAFDEQMKQMRDTRPVACLQEPFDKALKSKMILAQKKHLTGDSRQLPLGDLSKNEYRKCGLIATQKIRPEEPKKVKTDQKKDKKAASKSKKDKKSKKNAKKSNDKETTKVVNLDTDVKQESGVEPAPKKAKKTKVPDDDIHKVMNSLQAAKVVGSVITCNNNIFRINGDTRSNSNTFFGTSKNY